MTVIQKKPDNPIAHLSAEDIEELGHELDAIRAEVIAARGESDAALHPQGDRRQRKLELSSRAVLLFSLFPPAWLVGHRRPVGGQDPREHGDRPQRPARPVGLDARPEDPLHHLGVGQRLPVRAVEALAQRAAPHLHQRDRQGQRPRLRHHARRRGPALVPALPRPAAVELHQRLLLRVRHRGVRPRARQEPPLEAPPHSPEFQARAQAGAEARSAARCSRTTSCTRCCPARRSCTRWPPT